jgi:hypothetical protein
MDYIFKKIVNLVATDEQWHLPGKIAEKSGFDPSGGLGSQ